MSGPAVVRDPDRIFTGWKGPDPQDSRDFRVAPNARKLGLPYTVPAKVNNTDLVYPDLYDQLDLGSCVGWGARRCMEAITIKAGHGRQPLSALGAYKVAQEVAGWNVAEDTGLYLRDIVKSTRGRGYGREEDYPYLPGGPRWFQRPTADYYKRAVWYRNRVWYRIESLLELKAVLATRFVVMIGVAIAPNFYQAQGSGNVPDPVGPWIGGHCWAIDSYEDDSAWGGGGHMDGPNSWADWSGPTGRLRISYKYLEVAGAYPDMWVPAWAEAEQPPEM